MKSSQVETIKTDVAILGSGAAGLMAATSLPRGLRVLLVSKYGLSSGSTHWAQGGLACVVSEEDDIESHIQDTHYAGAGLCEDAIVRTLCEQGPQILRDLLPWVKFDLSAKGEFRLGREGAHEHARILQSGGDAIGKGIESGLIKRLEHFDNVKSLCDTRAIELLKDETGRCVGLQLWNPNTQQSIKVLAKAIILATGGYSQLYQETTNPISSTGDGAYLALSAGAEVMDMEFVQFHPTALFIAGAPRFLISEAVRGFGGVLRTASGDAFVHKYHAMGDLAPRDVVSRSIVTEMIRSREACVFLDLTHRKACDIEERFPNIHRVCAKFGLDVTRQWIPVRPAAHYTMGGVRVDEWGCSTVPGLYACGEAAANGVHGANRLASNSLLEALVFGKRCAEHISATDFKRRSSHIPSPEKVIEMSNMDDLDPRDLLRTLKSIMWRSVGVYRDKHEMEAVLKRLSTWRHLHLRPSFLSHEWLDFRSLNLVGLSVCKGALQRKESRGAHFRADFPEPDPVAQHSYFSLPDLDQP